MAPIKETTMIEVLFVLAIIGTAASEALTSLDYGGVSIKIYEMKSNIHKPDHMKIYHFTPVLELDHLSSSCIHNEIFGQYEVTFLIRFWNNQLKKDVVNHLKTVTDTEVKSSDVSIIKFNKVMLTTPITSELFTLDNKWVGYRGEQNLGFYLISQSLENCHRTATLMKNNPSTFRFKMYFSLSGDKMETRALQIKANAINQGSFFSKLSQRFPRSSIVLVTTDDAKKLISETVTNVAVEIVDDENLIRPISAIYRDIAGLLIKTTESTEYMDKAKWDSVFWKNENYRPDKTSKKIEDVYRKSDDEFKKAIEEYFENEYKSKENKEIVHSAELQVPGLMKNASSFNFKDGFRKRAIIDKPDEREEMFRILRYSKNYVERRGECFQPKSMPLSSVNMAVVADEFRNVDVIDTSITYYTTSLEMKVLTENRLNIGKNELVELQSKVREQGDRIRKVDQDNTTLAKHFIQLKKQIESKVNETAEYIRKLEDRC